MPRDKKQVDASTDTGSGVIENILENSSKKKSNKKDMDFASTLLDQAIKEFGSSHVKSYDDFLNSVYGVPIYKNLALQYLLAIDVIPLGRLINVVGPFGVTKSNFCWYLAALYLRYDGYIAFIDSERKGNPDQIHNLLMTYLNLGQDRSRWFSWNQAETLDKLLDYNVWYIKKLEEFGGKTINRPFMLLNDSLGSVTNEENVEKRFDDKDISGFSAARNAAKLSEDMQVFGPKLFDLPATGVFINHQKVKIATDGQPARAAYLPPVKSEKGGEHQRFAYSWIIELNPLRKDKVVCNGVSMSYPCYKMTTKKNAMGSNRPYIEVPYRYVWRGNKDGEELIWYDWNASLVLLLTDDKIFDQKKVVDPVIDIGYRPGKGYYSKRLGVEDLNITDFGQAIHDNPEVCAELQDKVLCIRRKPSYGNLITGIDKPQFSGIVPESEAGTVEPAGGEEVQKPAEEGV